MATRYTITFTGAVQGVGFRYTAVNIAQNYDVAGWVRNEPDGSVKCVAEGQPEQLDTFVATIKQSMQGYVKDTHISISQATGEFSGFRVRR